MALSKTMSLTNNFGELSTFSNTYIKVESTYVSKTSSTITLSIYKSKDGQLLEERFEEFDIDLDGPNPLKQAYLHLKTLPDYSGAADV